MANLGFFELTLFGIIALVVLGPEKLPVAARTLGRWYRTFRQASERLKREISSELDLLETQEMLKKELEEIRQSEAKMKAQMDALQQSVQRNEKHMMDAWQAIADTSATVDLPNDYTTALTTPMTNRWFLLSDYDRRRRLPKAPLMPNYLADPLLQSPQVRKP